MADARSLIKSYPEHKKEDRIIEALAEHGELDEHPLEDAPEAGQGDAGQADDDASSVADDDIMDQAEIPAVAEDTEIPAVGGGARAQLLRSDQICRRRERTCSRSLRT